MNKEFLYKYGVAEHLCRWKSTVSCEEEGGGEKIFCNFEKLKKLIKNKVCTSFVNLYLMFLYFISILIPDNLE